MVQARKDGKRAAFSRMEPYNVHKVHMFFPLTILGEVDLSTPSPRTH